VTFVSVRVTDSGGRAALAWTEGMRFNLPHALLERIGWLRSVDSRGNLVMPAEPARVTASDVDAVRLHAAFTDVPPVTSRLPLSYQRVPAWLRSAAAMLIGRRQRRRVDRWAAFPGWPIDLSADLVADLAGPSTAGGGPAPVLLTHDIDSPEGLRNLVDAFLPIEEAAGARSANYIVPCAWPPDPQLVDDARSRGHEIGVHGYDHSNRTPFARDDERRARLDGARAFSERYGAVGYRAPSLLRTRALVRDLAARYMYDSSMPTSGGPFPVPNNGCATARPFQVEGISEIPLTLPRDGSLRFLGYSAREISRLWIEIAETIARSGGIVVLLTHCEERFSGGRAMRDAYGEFVAHIASAPARFAFTTPANLARRLPDAHAV
jgi:peptidoglycan/xylan/chitin deacetylase (PgdA/CDA1 family)